jgi:transcriptional regulator with XRE-family HTH domain
MATRRAFKESDVKVELVRRGLTQRQLARLCNRSEETVGKALRGYPTSAATTRAIVGALARTPVLVHADLIEAAK